MLNDIFLTHNSKYSELLEIETLEQFETPLNKWWIQCDEDNQERIEKFITRSPIENGSHTNPNDEKDRIAFLTRVYSISSYSVNIAKSINEKQNLETQRAMFNTFISEFNSFYERLASKTFLINKYPFLLSRLSELKEKVEIKCSYLIPEKAEMKVFEKPIPKIQWLGKTNVLVTLIYDLWKGQDKGKNKPSTPSLLKADKKDLEKLLTENFLDSKGNPLTIATVSDYLNTSKPEKRAKEGVRIEV